MEFEFWDRKWTKRGNPGVGELVPKEQGSAPARAPLTGSSGEPRPRRAPVSTEPGPAQRRALLHSPPSQRPAGLCLPPLGAESSPAWLVGTEGRADLHWSGRPATHSTVRLFGRTVRMGSTQPPVRTGEASLHPPQTAQAFPGPSVKGFWKHPRLPPAQPPPPPGSRTPESFRGSRLLAPRPPP